jgi:hypothetical protein
VITNLGLMTTSAADQFLVEVCYHTHHICIHFVHAFHIALVPFSWKNLVSK